MNRLEKAKLAAIQTEEELQDIIDLADKTTWSITIYEAYGLGHGSGYSPYVIAPGAFIHHDEHDSAWIFPKGIDPTAEFAFCDSKSLSDRNIGANYNDNHFFVNEEDAIEFVEACKADEAHCARRNQWLQECREWDDYDYDDDYDDSYDD